MQREIINQDDKWYICDPVLDPFGILDPQKKNMNLSGKGREGVTVEVINKLSQK